VHKKRFAPYASDFLTIWIVDGEMVRTLRFIDFTEGGHDAVYPFMPKNEVWIDDDIKESERKFVLLHELRERNLMCQGWEYDPYDGRVMTRHTHAQPIHRSAHYSASQVEYFCRVHPDHLEKKLQHELHIARTLPL